VTTYYFFDRHIELGGSQLLRTVGGLPLFTLVDFSGH
jgi:hypothetical protein